MVCFVYLELLAFIVPPLSIQEAPVSQYVYEQTGPPLYGVLCPDWIKWAGIPENVCSFSLFAWVRGGEWHELLTKQNWLYKCDCCWNVELFNTYSKEKITLTPALIDNMSTAKSFCCCKLVVSTFVCWWWFGIFRDFYMPSIMYKWNILA